MHAYTNVLTAHNLRKCNNVAVRIEAITGSMAPIAQSQRTNFRCTRFDSSLKVGSCVID